MPAELHLSVNGYSDSDDEERAKLARSLRTELLATDAEAVYHPPAPTPDRAKGSGLEWAQLVVAFGGTLPALIVAIRSWLGRRPAGVTISVKIDGDEITIAEPTDAEQAQLLEAWLSRHGRD